ncbi:MAG: MFS transporter [Alphaproteobacteria bacterium]|nr:MFS transporter [Alphaproteobacteria bacterium]
MVEDDKDKLAFSLMNTAEAEPRLPMKIFLFWFIGAFFYLYQSVLKVMPSVIAQDLTIDLNIAATSLGALGGIYFLAYASLQLPIGILLDRFGVRRLMSFSVALCAIGAFLFSLSSNFYFALGARFIIGMGSSGAFIGAIKLITMWFPTQLVPIFTGLTVFVGSMGSVIGNKPMAILLRHITWREACQLVAFIGFGLAGVCFLFLRNNTAQQNRIRNFKDLLDGFKQVVKSPQILLIAFFAFFIYLPLSVLADMWGNLFIQRAYGLSRTQASECIQMIYFGVAFGAPAFGLVASIYTNYRIIFRIITVSQIPIMAVIIWFQLPNILALQAACFLLGVLLGGQALKFNAAFAHTSSAVSASIVGFVNMLCMLGGFVFQQSVGILLDVFWDGSMKDGHIFYTADTFSKALSIHIFALAICFFLTYYIRNKEQEVDEELD